MSKYRAIRSGKYASKKEARRAADLQLMQSLGIISELKEQVPFVLLPKQTDSSGKTVERPCTYVADFTYRENGAFVVEDTKGYRTSEYIVKRKLMLWMHEIRIKEI